MKIPFTSEEVRRAIIKLKNNKSSGPDDISAELFKNSPDELFYKIADLFNSSSSSSSAFYVNSVNCPH